MADEVVVPPVTPPAAFAWPEKWKDQLPEDIRGEDSLKIINDIPALAKSYIHAQKTMGMDKIVVPSKHATEEDWKRVYNKLGLPEKMEDYKIEFPKTVQFKEEFVKGLTEHAFKNGIMPKQLTPVLNWFAEMSNAEATAEKTASDTLRATALNELKTEWGQAYDQNIKKAQSAFNQYGDESIKAYLDKSGLSSDPNMLRLFARIGEGLQDDTLPNGNSASSGKLTPAEAIKQYNQILMDPSHPYALSGHPNHKAAVSEVEGLFAAAYPEPKNS